MQPEEPCRYSVADQACWRFLEIFECQLAEGRAAILGFLHLSEDSDRINVTLKVGETGRISLLMETLATIQD